MLWLKLYILFTVCSDILKAAKGPVVFCFFCDLM